MNADHRLRIVECHERRDAGSEVPTARGIAVVTKALHQAVPETGDVAVVDSCARRPLGEGVARERGKNEVERRPVDAMGLRVSQKGNHRKQFEKRARPTVGQDERYAAARSSALVDEVNANTVEFGSEVMETVQRALLRTPVEVVGPVFKNRSEGLEVCALLPRTRWRAVRPARVVDTSPEVREDFLVDVDGEWLDAERPHRPSSHHRPP